MIAFVSSTVAWPPRRLPPTSSLASCGTCQLLSASASARPPASPTLLSLTSSSCKAGTAPDLMQAESACPPASPMLLSPIPSSCRSPTVFLLMASAIATPAVEPRLLEEMSSVLRLVSALGVSMAMATSRPPSPPNSLWLSLRICSPGIAHARKVCPSATPPSAPRAACSSRSSARKVAARWPSARDRARAPSGRRLVRIMESLHRLGSARAMMTLETKARTSSVSQN